MSLQGTMSADRCYKSLKLMSAAIEMQMTQSRFLATADVAVVVAVDKVVLETTTKTATMIQHKGNGNNDKLAMQFALICQCKQFVCVCVCECKCQLMSIHITYAPLWPCEMPFVVLACRLVNHKSAFCLSIYKQFHCHLCTLCCLHSTLPNFILTIPTTFTTQQTHQKLPLLCYNHFHFKFNTHNPQLLIQYSLQQN